MKSKVSISIQEIDENGKTSVRTFRVRDDQTYSNLMDELQFCKLINEYFFYPDKIK